MKRTTIWQDPEIMKEFGPCVPVKVTGDETTQETLAQISTGAAGSYIDLKEAARLGLRQTGEHRSRKPREGMGVPHLRRGDGDTRAGRHHRPAPHGIAPPGVRVRVARNHRARRAGWSGAADKRPRQHRPDLQGRVGTELPNTAGRQARRKEEMDCDKVARAAERIPGLPPFPGPQPTGPHQHGACPR